MYSKIKTLLSGIFFLLFFTFCSESENQNSAPQQETESELQINDPRARAASEGGISAVYFTIANNTTAPDTLLSISSDIAELVEIHESFEQEGGMMGMRETGALEVPAGSVVHLEPGGLHIMLIRLTESLEIDEEFDLTLHFAQKGDETIRVSVQQI